MTDTVSAMRSWRLLASRLAINEVAVDVAYADVFVNDAFGTAHRAHASTVGIAKLLPAYAGLLMEREIALDDHLRGDAGARPGPNDWEATVRTAEPHHLSPGTYELRVDTPDDLVLSGHAMLRFSDGHQHLFRGDGELGGVDAALA